MKRPLLQIVRGTMFLCIRSVFIVAPACVALSPDAAAGEKKMQIKKSNFGEVDGKPVSLYSCVNENGLTAKFTNYGATVVALETPDRNGEMANINWGFDSLQGYQGEHPYFGATVGRFCNRIAGGKFPLGGKEYKLAANNGPNHLHGGVKGFNRVFWQAEVVQNENSIGVKFTHLSKDGEEGYPGNLKVTATYLLTNQNELSVEFTAETDKPTPVNLTNHNYWNLGGVGSGTILNHVLKIEADRFLSVDDTLIPTGELTDVKGTALDFTKAEKIGARIKEIKADPVGYDHCYVLRSGGGELALAARVVDPKSGRVMEIRTTQPGIQLYTGNFLAGKAAEGGAKQYEGFCLETQHYPDSPNQPAFPNTILKPGAKFRQLTVHKFSTE